MDSSRDYTGFDLREGGPIHEEPSQENRYGCGEKRCVRKKAIPAHAAS
jgi:hypothetical protein